GLLRRVDVEGSTEERLSLRVVPVQHVHHLVVAGVAQRLLGGAAAERRGGEEGADLAAAEGAPSRQLAFRHAAHEVRELRARAVRRPGGPAPWAAGGSPPRSSPPRPPRKWPARGGKPGGPSSPALTWVEPSASGRPGRGVCSGRSARGRRAARRWRSARSSP